jgi:hypothetical protein
MSVLNLRGRIQCPHLQKAHFNKKHDHICDKVTLTKGVFLYEVLRIPAQLICFNCGIELKFAPGILRRVENIAVVSSKIC